MLGLWFRSGKETDVTNELMYELLKAIRGDITRLGEAVARDPGPCWGSGWHGALALRVDRIERRLELNDGKN